MFLTSHSSQIINLMFMNSVGSTSQMAEALHFPTENIELVLSIEQIQGVNGGNIQEEQFEPMLVFPVLHYSGRRREEYPNGAMRRTSQWIVGMETGCLQTLWKVLLVEHDQYSVVYNASNPVVFIDDYAINS